MPEKARLKSLVLMAMTAFGLPVALAQEDTTLMWDEIVLKNGSRLYGRVTAIRDGVVSIETDFAGTLLADQAQIQSIATQTPVVMQMADGQLTGKQPILVQDHQLEVVSPEGADKSYALSELVTINPEPWELGLGNKWTGLVSFAWALERGNSDTDELDYKLDTQWLRVNDRYTVRLNGELDEANEQKSADNWRVVTKYDRFMEGAWYWGANAVAESDKFADLDLRYYIGPYLGHRKTEDPILSLEIELGMAYVKEDFNSAADNDYPGANWNIHLSSNYLGGDSRLYFDHIGIWNLETTSELILNSTFGLSFPLLFNLEAAAEILFEHDSGAVEGVEELDQTYKFRIGYSW